MSWRVKVCHTSGYRYSSPVHASYNEARITPQTTLSQTTLESMVEITPQASTYRYWDYWSTLVHAFDVHTPHDQLTVVGTSTVETGDPRMPDDAASWDDVAAAVDREAEYLAPSRYTGTDPEIEAWSAELRHDTPLATVTAALDAVGSRLEYVKGVTEVSTAAVQVFHHAQGVCQDFAHLAIAVLRTLGLPARYVSGYLHPHAKAAIGEEVSGVSHAWIEAWLGDWYAFDPTNAAIPGERHVIVARGRDYYDVSPLRGIYSGGKAEKLAVSVELTRMG